MRVETQGGEHGLRIRRDRLHSWLSQKNPGKPLHIKRLADGRECHMYPLR